jgi:uncharacterized protein YlxW (UPF0749 family)
MVAFSRTGSFSVCIKELLIQALRKGKNDENLCTLKCFSCFRKENNKLEAREDNNNNYVEKKDKDVLQNSDKKRLKAKVEEKQTENKKYENSIAVPNQFVTNRSNIRNTSQPTASKIPVRKKIDKKSGELFSYVLF